MRHIPTTAARVEQLKKQAKRLKATKGGKHADLLNAVAKSAGYDHWHHVVQCQEKTERPPLTTTLGNEVERVLKAEIDGVVAAIMTGPELSLDGPLILFSTGIGDAWLVDSDGSAACLMWQGVRRPTPFRDLADAIEIDWDGDLEVIGQFVHIACPTVAQIGNRVVEGYPVEQITRLLVRARLAEHDMAHIFGQVDAIDLTDSVIADLVVQGWSQVDLEHQREAGARYSPKRKSLLYPVISNFDE